MSGGWGLKRAGSLCPAAEDTMRKQESATWKKTSPEPEHAGALNLDFLPPEL